MDRVMRDFRPLRRFRFKKYWSQSLLCAASCAAVCVVTIFWNFQKMGLSHWDEYYYIETAVWNMSPLGSHIGFFQAYEPPLFPFFLSLMFTVFGIHDYVAIAASEMMAVLLCVLTFWWTRRHCDLQTAVVSVLILASTSMFVYYGKMALTDMTYTFFFSAAIFAYYDAIKSGRNSTFLVAGVLLACTMATKYTGFQLLLIVLIYLPVSGLPIFKGKVSFKKSLAYLRELSNDLLKLWLSIAPVSVFAVAFLFYLAGPFPLLSGDIIVTGSWLQNIGRGLNYLAFTIYPLKMGALNPQLFLSVEFYGDVVADYVGALVIALAVVGAAIGLLRRQVLTGLLSIWPFLVFISFASLTGTWPRVLLPMIVPLSILAGRGVLSCANALVRFLQSIGFRRLRKKRYSLLLRVSFVTLLIVLHFYSSLPAIANVHSAYREAAAFIANLPKGLVFYRTQPVLLVYLQSLGAKSLIVDAMPLLNQSDAVVLDFIADASPDYAQIQARVSQMTLAWRIINDAPQLNMLDTTPFSVIRQSDPDRMSIRIYLSSSPSMNVSSSPSMSNSTGSSYFLSQTPVKPVLLEVWIFPAHDRGVCTPVNSVLRT